MRNFLALLLLFVANFCPAQKEHNIWYFGNRAGMDFNGGPPVVLTNSVMNQWEGCSSVCDTSGKLLFYTDGITVWNRNHLIMTNGTGLSGNSSSTQSALIVRKPGSSTIYYVFSSDGVGSMGMKYSEIDMTLSGGLGAVTVNKNILLLSNCSEKMCGAMHANKTDVWVMGHAANSDAYY